MSSLQPFVPSSPLAVGLGCPRDRKSRFTYKNLSQFHSSSTNCPLRVIAHVDLDAFYAQCESIRLDLPEDQPLAVQQWQGLIAINYPARKFGLNRHVTATEARKACPDIILQHVATWREGDEKWAYYENASKHIATHKVSLDPYRQESRKILAVIKETLPAQSTQKVEKAGIDEVFLDLSSQVHSLLLERYPVLDSPPPYDDPTEYLPRPPTSVLDWKTDALIDLDSTETELDDPDWDDIVMLLGSEIVRAVRSAIKGKLKYTCSAGIAHNKMLAKLGSAHKKPNQQTVVRNRAIQMFLSEIKFTKIRNLGGKLGDQLVAAFGTDTVKDILSVSLDQMKIKMGDDTGTWVYNVVRGIDTSEVNPRTQIKSMLSAKSFRPYINSFEQGVRWLRIFVADIFSRLVEEGVLENKRRPKTINLHHRHGGQTKSRQVSIPMGRAIDEVLLFDLAKSLLTQVISEGNAWPCLNLMLSVSGFEDGVTANKGIGAFLLKGEEAKALHTSKIEDQETNEVNGRSVKRRRLDARGIEKFLIQKSGEDVVSEDDFGAQEDGPAEKESFDSSEFRETIIGETEVQASDSLQSMPNFTGDTHGHSSQVNGILQLRQQSITSFTCSRCSKAFPVNEKQEHEDWHFAKDLHASDKPRPTMKVSRLPSGGHCPSNYTPVGTKTGHAKLKKPTNSSSKVDRSQSTLPFKP